MSTIGDLVCYVHESPSCELQGRDHGNEPQVGARPSLSIGKGDADVAESLPFQAAKTDRAPFIAAIEQITAIIHKKSNHAP